MGEESVSYNQHLKNIFDVASIHHSKKGAAKALLTIKVLARDGIDAMPSFKVRLYLEEVQRELEINGQKKKGKCLKNIASIAGEGYRNTAEVMDTFA